MYEFWKHDHRKRRNGTNSQLSDALFGDIDPRYLKEKETTRDRMVVELAGNGMNISDISKITGMAKNAVSNTIRQPWARERIIERMKNDAQKELKELIEAEGVASFQKIVEIRNNPMSNPDVALRAAESILNRILGKPTQPVEQRTQQLETLSDAELQRIALGDPAGTGGNGTNS